MRGNIYYIVNNNYGYINGKDNCTYFFHKSDLLNCTIYQLDDGDYVDFEIQKNTTHQYDKAINIRKLSAYTHNSENITTPGINKAFKFNAFNEDEIKIINNLKKVFYLTNGNIISTGQSTYKYCFAKPTNTFTRSFNLNREIVVVFSDYISFEPRALETASHIANQIDEKLRIDRGCQIFISSDLFIEKKILELYKDTNYNYIIVPFTYRELQENITEDYILTRFKKYLFDIDLFASSIPVQDDLFFFGRRDYVFDIVNKSKNNIHCGIFGLRRSGKTSMLYAVERALNNDNYPAVYIPCQSELAQANWKLALYKTVHSAYQKTGVKLTNIRSKQSYLDENTAASFEEDLNNIYSKILKPIVLLFDEIEAITFDELGASQGWKNGSDYIPFWNVIRGYYLKYPKHISIIIAGTNPMINEIPVLKSGSVNPMFGQLAKANQGAYLLPFTIEDTKTMVNALGGYMGLYFDETVCANITSDCGGHPYLIRLLCSYINEYLKKHNVLRPKTVSLSLYNPIIKNFEETNEATGFYLMILNILVNSYPTEFKILKEIAINGDNFVSNFVDDNALLHLIGYGLVESDSGHYIIKFNTIAHYLKGKYKFERMPSTIEEQKEEIQYRINIVEMTLRNLVKTTLKVLKGTDEAKKIVLNAMSSHPAINAKDINDAQTMAFYQLFDPSLNKIYFSLLSKIILDNIDMFVNIFNSASTTEISQHFNMINKARRVPDHSYTEKSERWGIEDFLEFRKSISWLEKAIEMY